MSNKDQILVLGAGPAGIGAGIALGHRAVVLDNCPDLGGLCRTIVLDGAIFDWGGHSFHTPHAAIRDLVFGSLEMYEQTRDARCYVQGEMIPYPFQKNFQLLGNSAIEASAPPDCDKATRAKARQTWRNIFGLDLVPESLAISCCPITGSCGVPILSTWP